MNSKKRLLLGIIGTLTAASLVGCDNSTSTSGTGGGSETELLFWCNNGYLADFELRLAEFTKETGIKVRVEGIQANSWGELAQQIATSSYSGDLPDVADIASEAMATLVASDLIVPIDEYYERDKAEMQETLDEISPVLLNAHTYEGKNYSLPTTWNNMCIYYNKNVLKEAGVLETDPNYPHNGWTIENFLYCCDKVTSKNQASSMKNKYGYKLQNQYFLSIEPWLNSYGTSVLNADWTDTAIDGQDAKDCFQMLHGMMNASDVTKQYSPKFGGTAEYDLFYSDRLAFMGNGLPYVYNLYTGGFNGSKNDVSKLQEGYDVVPFPTVDGTSSSVIGVGACPIFKNSKNKDAAWELSKFLSSKKFQEEYMTEDVWAIPVVESAARILETKPFYPENGEIFYDSLENATLIPAPEAYSAIELEIRKWFGGYMSNTSGFTIEGDGANSLSSLASNIRSYLGE